MKEVHKMLIGRPVEGLVKRALPVQMLLEWAFRVERAQLDPPGQIEAEGFRPGISTIWLMIQRGNLGCQIDGGGSSDPHEDAEVVAAIVASLPSNRGGFRMAARVAELARAGLTPDWIVDEVQRVEPVEWHKNPHGRFGKTKVVPPGALHGWGRAITAPVLCCPVNCLPAPQQIAAARRGYLEWWVALQEIQVNLTACRALRRHSVTRAMPPVAPWRRLTPKMVIDKS